jgi:hypothetical protein
MTTEEQCKACGRNCAGHTKLRDHLYENAFRDTDKRVPETQTYFDLVSKARPEALRDQRGIR